MTHTKNQQGEWVRLVESAVRIKQLAPWQWMNVEDVFGIKHPETGEIVSAANDELTEETLKTLSQFPTVRAAIEFADARRDPRVKVRPPETRSIALAALRFGDRNVGLLEIEHRLEFLVGVLGKTIRG